MIGLAPAEARALRLALDDPTDFARRALILAVELPMAVTTAHAQTVVDGLVAAHPILRTSYCGTSSGPRRHVDAMVMHQLIEGNAVALEVPDSTVLHSTDLLRFGIEPDHRGAWIVSHEMLLDTASAEQLRQKLRASLLGEAPRSEARPGRAFEEYAGAIEEDSLTAEPLGRGPVRLHLVDPDLEVTRNRFAERVRVFPGTASDGFRRVCREHRMTPFMAAASVTVTQLAEQFGCGEVTLATAVDRRPRAFAGVLGNFSVDLTIAVTTGKTFAQTAAATRAAVLAVLREQAPDKNATVLPTVRCHFLATGRHYFTVLDEHAPGDAWDEPTNTSNWPLDIGFAEDGQRRIGLWQQWDRRLWIDADVERIAVGCITQLSS